MLKHFCNQCGCNHLIPYGVRYCTIHARSTTEDNRERHREYDAHCRNKKSKAFYSSAVWQATRARVLARDTNIDIYLYITCGKVVPADTVHHIVELSEDWSKRCDLDNLISISNTTHSTISRLYKDKAQRATIQQTLRECIHEYQQRVIHGSNW